MLSIASLVRKEALFPDNPTCEKDSSRSPGVNQWRLLQPIETPEDSDCDLGSKFTLPPPDFCDHNTFFNKNNLVEKVKFPNCDLVFERQQEIVELAKALLGLQSCKVSLQGLPFSGKKSVVQGLAQKIKNNLVPPSLRDYAILDVCDFLSDLHDTNARYSPYCFKKRTIYFVKNLNEFLSYASDGSFTSQELLLLIKKPQIPVIVVQSCLGKSGVVEYLGMFFWTVRITDPCSSQFQTILKIQAEKITKIFGSEFSDDILELVQTTVENEKNFSETLSSIRKSFLLLDRLAGDFEFRKFENSDESSCISRKDVLAAAKAIFPDKNLGKFPSYIS